VSAPAFALPTELEAHEPPEARGLARDEVRLMVATRGDGRIAHASFRDLPELLEPGDLLVVNNSATLPAAVAARRRDGSGLELRFAGPAPGLDPDEWWVAERRSADGGPDDGSHRTRETVELPGGATAAMVAPYAGGQRLWLTAVHAGEPLHEYLWRYGHPIQYSYVTGTWPLDAFQTVYALVPGSAEMPSAGRPFTPELITALAARGVLVAPLTLHTGLSSPERHEPPQAERFEVPTTTADAVNATRAWGGRVIAVGTTVARALETVAEPDGTVRGGDGWTNLVITPERGLRSIDGLLSGWHEPAASHLRLLEAAAASPELLARSYDAALECGYLWHEFGDSHLIVP
jgi:S-adenosylmethionine:tRNA ribosyltransferase-isomerase